MRPVRQQQDDGGGGGARQRRLCGGATLLPLLAVYALALIFTGTEVCSFPHCTYCAVMLGSSPSPRTAASDPTLVTQRLHTAGRGGCSSPHPPRNSQVRGRQGAGLKVLDGS